MKGFVRIEGVFLILLTLFSSERWLEWAVDHLLLKVEETTPLLALAWDSFLIVFVPPASLMFAVAWLGPRHPRKTLVGLALLGLVASLETLSIAWTVAYVVSTGLALLSCLKAEAYP